MIRTPDEFERASPQKVLQEAEKYSKSTFHLTLAIKRFHQIPKQLSKSMAIKDLAESNLYLIQAGNRKLNLPLSNRNIKSNCFENSKKEILIIGLRLKKKSKQ